MRAIIPITALIGLVAAGCSSDRGGSASTYDSYNTGWGTSAPVEQRGSATSGTSTGADASGTSGSMSSEEHRTQGGLNDLQDESDINNSTVPGGGSTERSFDPASNTNNVPDNLSGEEADPSVGPEL